MMKLYYAIKSIKYTIKLIGRALISSVILNVLRVRVMTPFKMFDIKSIEEWYQYLYVMTGNYKNLSK
jgi:hypothetical protein